MIVYKQGDWEDICAGITSAAGVDYAVGGDKWNEMKRKIDACTKISTYCEMVTCDGGSVYNTIR